MIWTLKIEIPKNDFTDYFWNIEIELEASTSLAELHSIIQRATNFHDDHLYEFFIARTERSRQHASISYDDPATHDTTLEEIFPLEQFK